MLVLSDSNIYPYNYPQGVDVANMIWPRCAAVSRLRTCYRSKIGAGTGRVVRLAYRSLFTLARGPLQKKFCHNTMLHSNPSPFYNQEKKYLYIIRECYKTGLIRKKKLLDLVYKTPGEEEGESKSECTSYIYLILDDISACSLDVSGANKR
ncbi:hypothetical protein B9Z19DRAFT_1083264 [Tuber borchii]|uniref:Uncharacterized protein n=1 Tax=Tuber borchii TaxID=42251 RepID=A0A2T6ZTF0_TUBBO|nr:hypothetical protein B9Z19DRAFT_1083264 [Tuber borchii]